MVIYIYQIRSFSDLQAAEEYCSNPAKTTIVPAEWGAITNLPKDIALHTCTDPDTEQPILYYIASYQDACTTLAKAIQDNLQILQTRSGGSIQPSGILCHHIICSFPANIQISNADMLLIATELLRRTEAPRYSMIFCHIQPVADVELGIFTGKQKHIHFLVPAYLDCMQYTPGSRKVKFCPKLGDLRQIADQLAVDAGLPIIRTPDTDRKMGSHEKRLDAVGKSRKTELAETILVASICTSCWADYVAAMQSVGYRVDSNAKRTLYTDSTGQQIRDRTLGREYCRPALETRWEQRRQTQAAAITQALDLSSDIATILSAASTVYPLSVALSVGPNWDRRTVTLPISGYTRATRDTLLTYLDPEQTYSVLQADGSTYISAAGEEIITAILYLQQLYYPDPMEIPLIASKHKKEEARKKRAYDAEEQARRRAIARHLWEPGIYGPDGRLRSLPMLLIGLVLILLDKEELLMVLNDETIFDKRDDEPNERFFANKNLQLQVMYDSYRLSDQLEIRDIVDLDNRLLQLKAIHKDHIAALQRLQAELPHWEALDAAVTAYMRAEKYMQTLDSMPEEDRAAAEVDKQATIARLHLAKSYLDRNGYSKIQYIDLTRKYAAMLAKKRELEELIAQDHIDYVGLQTIARGWNYTIEYADMLTHKHLPPDLNLNYAIRTLQTFKAGSIDYCTTVSRIRNAMQVAEQQPNRQQTRSFSR